MPTIILTNTFKVTYKKLTLKEQSQADKALRFMANDPKHPSLQIHRIKGTLFWEVYVNKDIRIVFERNQDTFILQAIGHHDILKKY